VGISTTSPRCHLWGASEKRHATTPPPCVSLSVCLSVCLLVSARVRVRGDARARAAAMATIAQAFRRRLIAPKPDLDEEYVVSV
jgi:hypothetical protein